MARRTLVLVILALAGCAPAPPPASTSALAASRAAADDARARDTERALARREDRVRELEAELGLARARARELEGELLSLREEAARRATRIGDACVPTEEGVPDAAPSEPVAAIEESAARPVLRLYGPPRPALATSGVSAIPGPVPPPMIEGPPLAGARLPVMTGAGGDPEAGVPAIPVAPLVVAEAPSVAPVAAPSAAPAHDPAVEEYRAALRDLAERRLDAAHAGVERFLRRHPEHPYADDALYWRGEIEYARRDYAEALRTFSGLVERYPRGAKVPEALLRIGLCHRRLGRRPEAERVLERLRRSYPNSVAARMASQEDA